MIDAKDLKNYFIEISNKERAEIRKQIYPIFRQMVEERYGFLFKDGINENGFQIGVTGSCRLTYQIQWKDSLRFYNKNQIWIKATLFFVDNSKKNNWLEFSECINYDLEQERRERKLKALGL